VGEGQTIRAGVQANEAVFTDILAAAASLAVLVEDTTLQTRDGQAAMQSRILPALSERGLAQMQAVFGLVQNQLADAKEVQRGVKTIADDYLSSTNRTDNAEAAAQLLTLQNQLQASYQAGANILKLSLVNYI
jgi:flagellin-like hook-associated protein FlgL